MGHSDYQAGRRMLDWPDDVLDLATALGLDTFTVLGGLFRLNLRAMRRGASRAGERMVAWAPEPDRTLLQRAEICDGFMACFEEVCRQGPRGPVADMRLIARPWGFDLATVNVPVLLWHGERDRNVPVEHGRYLAGAIPNCRATIYEDNCPTNPALPKP
jgi:pimeloyl-ACP methyl ester carboxylesterase